MNTFRPIVLALLAGFGLFASGCAKVPHTDRVQLNMISRSEELRLGKQAAVEIYEQSRICRDPAMSAKVRRVGQRVVEQVDMPDANWKFHCVEDYSFNALCVAGGIIFVHSGVLTTIDNEDQLACIIGHEIGHALARHSAENLSRQRLTNAAIMLVALSVGGATHDGDAMIGAVNIMQVATKFGLMLPHNRLQEYEADRLGLILMTKAGYDPNQFPALWQKLMDNGTLKNFSDFAMVHPADDKRLAAMKALLPQVLATYTPAANQGGQPASPIDSEQLKAQASALSADQASGQNLDQPFPQPAGQTLSQPSQQAKAPPSDQPSSGNAN